MDIDAGVEPDLIGSITDIDMPDNTVDAIYASHILEHVERWHVERALSECYRVLRPGGDMVLVTPDLAAWAAEIVAHPELVEYVGAVAGYKAPVTMLDALFGFGPDIQAGHDAMRHRTGFTKHSLAQWLQLAGFIGRIAARDWQLCAMVQKSAPYQQ
jgi:SAM-dependent methyltransferase